MIYAFLSESWIHQKSCDINDLPSREKICLQTTRGVDDYQRWQKWIYFPKGVLRHFTRSPLQWVGRSSSQSNNFVNHQLIVKIIILMKHRQVYCESVVVKQKRSLDFNGGGCWNSHRQVKRKAETELDCHRCFFLLLIFYFYFLQRQRRMI